MSEDNQRGAPVVGRDSRNSSLHLRSRIMAGLVLVVPIWLTVVVVTFVFGLTRDASLWLIEALLHSPIGRPLLRLWEVDAIPLAERGLQALPTAVQWGVSVVAVFVTVVLLYLAGAITANVAGRRIVHLVEALVDRVPFVTVVYHASKKVLETFVGDESRPFQQVVLVPFPSKDSRSIGFVTHVSTDHDGKPLYTVLVATAPNPTTGFVFVSRPSEIVELDWSIEDAMKVIMSGGVLMPDVLPVSKSVPDTSTTIPVRALSGQVHP